jgi:hypothetical protein
MLVALEERSDTLYFVASVLARGGIVHAYLEESVLGFWRRAGNRSVTSRPKTVL